MLFAVTLTVLLPRCGTVPTEFDLDVGVTDDATGQQDARGEVMESDATARSDAALPSVPDGSDATDVPDGLDLPDSDDGLDVARDAGLADTVAFGGTLGAPCRSESDCPSDTWCSDVSGFERCAPRLFGGAEHQIDFVFVPAGTFQQGTPGATNEERPYLATISRDYFVSRTEVTQGQWKAATEGTNPSCRQSTREGSCTTRNANDGGPVEQVDWYSTLAYANWLSAEQGLSACYALTGCSDPTDGWHDGTHSGCTGAAFDGPACTGYRILTESEWERAARGGTTSTFYWGEATDEDTVGRYARIGSNSRRGPQPVGGKLPNAYGLFDMSGNVREWVWDWALDGGFYWFDYPSGSATDYTGPASGFYRGTRGGAVGRFLGDASMLRSASRHSIAPESGSADVGIRLARTGD